MTLPLVSGLRQSPVVPGTGALKIFNPEPGADPLILLTTDLSQQELGGKTAWKKAPGDCKEAPTPEQTHRLAQAMMAFTTDLFSLVAQNSTRPNLILSPLSVALALSHLALGTMAAPVQATRHLLTRSLLVGASSIKVTWMFGKKADSSLCESES